MRIKLSNGNEVVIDDVVDDGKAAAIKWLREYKERRASMEPIIEIVGTAGITATFPDGATISMTITGLFPCSACDETQCQHFHAAMSHWNRFRWEMAEREDSPWGARLLASIGLGPPFIVRPEYFTKQTRWSPIGKGEEIAPGILVWQTGHGRLYRFDVNKGHVYIGTDHPDGHTPCLICRGDGCDHVERALELEGHVEETKKKSGA